MKFIYIFSCREKKGEEEEEEEGKEDCSFWSFYFYTVIDRAEIGYHNRGGHHPVGRIGGVGIDRDRKWSEARTIMSGQKVYTLSGV